MTKTRNKKTTFIHCRIDPATKKQAETIFKEAGLNTSTAINLFLKQVIVTTTFRSINEKNKKRKEVS